MRRKYLLLIALIFTFSNLYSITSTGFSIGLGYTKADWLDDVDENIDSYYEELNRFSLPITFEQLMMAENIGSAVDLELGIKIGFLRLFNYEYDDGWDSAYLDQYSIPMMLYGRIGIQNFTLGFGYGYHAWYTSSDYYYEEDGFEPCFLIEPGYCYPLTRALDLITSVSYYSLPAEDIGMDDETVLGLNLGIRIKH